jgi:hypothetical protein
VSAFAIQLIVGPAIHAECALAALRARCVPRQVMRASALLGPLLLLFLTFLDLSDSFEKIQAKNQYKSDSLQPDGTYS